MPAARPQPAAKTHRLVGPVPWPRPRPSLASPAAPRREGLASACRQRLSGGVAVAQALPPITGNDGCGTTDAVRLEAIWSRAGRRIAVEPPAVLDCGMAEAFARWVREEASGALAVPGPQLAGIKVDAAYECRGRNRVPGAQISQHGYGNALDVRGFVLTDGSVRELASPSTDLSLRLRLRESACARFTTVLGPGSDGYHEAHIHFDVIQRRSGYRICQWDVR